MAYVFLNFSSIEKIYASNFLFIFIQCYMINFFTVVINYIISVRISNEMFFHSTIWC